MSEGNGWDQWKNHVLAELERHGKNAHDLRNDLQIMQVAIVKEMGEIGKRISALETKSVIGGAVAGLIASGIISAVIAVLLK